MIKIYDKAQWHLDAGEEKTIVLSRFQTILNFLNSKNMLSKEGEEIFSLGVDSSISLNEKMLTETGIKFLDEYYDKIIKRGADDISFILNKEYGEFIKQN